MKNTYLLIFGSFFITQTVLAQRVRFDANSAAPNKRSSSNINHSNGSGGAYPTGFGNAGDFKPTEDPKNGYILAFKDAVKRSDWREATNLQSVLKEKFNFLVYFERILNPKEIDQIAKFQAEYNDYFKAGKFDAAKELDTKVWGLFAVHLVKPAPVAVSETKLTEKELAIIIEKAQITYNGFFKARDFESAEKLYNEIWVAYNKQLVKPIFTKGETLTLTAVSQDTAIRMETSKIGARTEAIKLDTLNSREIASEAALIDIKE